LYVSGSFMTIGGAAAPGVAVWDGAAWQALGGGADGPVLALAAFNGGVVAGGDFASVGGTGYSRFAVWGCEPAPTCTPDFNGDGDVGTDADIEAFFECLAGSCCASCGSPDFNGDGDVGTDADIESFFRVLAGGTC
jgi:hypothetical protein